MNDSIDLFRIILQVSDLDAASAFYSKLLASEGRRLRGARHYFDCGAVILALVDVTTGGEDQKPLPDNIYFSSTNIEAIYERANELGCLSDKEVHGAAAGEIITRPWGERSFYVRDPFGNGLCFVDSQTVYTGI